MVLKYRELINETDKGCYAQWLRQTTLRSLADKKQIGFLCGSSVEEPVELLGGFVQQAFQEKVSSRYHSVFLNGGNPYVIDQLSSKYDVEAECVICTTGATSSLSLLYRTYLAPGDHILVESPCFDVFADFAYEQRAELSFFKRRREIFAIDPAEIESLIRPNTRFVVLSNLHNPSGMMLDNEILKDLVQIAKSHKIKFIFDEVYGDYASNFASNSSWSGPASKFSPYFISVSSLTKIYGLSSLKCGWIIAHPDILAPVRAFSNQFEFGVSKLSHAVAALVMENHQIFDKYWQDELKKTKPIMERHYDQWLKDGLVFGKFPDFGCISFPGLTGISDTSHFTDWLYDAYGVAVVPGELFDLSGHVRIGYGVAPDKLDYSLKQFSLGLRAYGEEVLAK